MARVEIESQSWGTLFTKNSGETFARVLAGATAQLYTLSGASATIYTAATGGSSNTSALTSNDFGRLRQSDLPRYVEEGTYTLTVGAITDRVEASAGASSVIRANSVSELTDALAKAVIIPGLTIELASNTTYSFTSNLAIPEGTSIRGGGRSTLLQFTNCDGFVFNVSNYIGPQVFENFAVQGNGYTYTAVKALGDADAGRVEGVTFRDVLIWSFKTAFHLRSTHGWHLDHVKAYNIWEGVRIAGQTILPTIDGGSEFSRGAATGTGTSTGLLVASSSDYNPSGTTIKGPEGLRVRDSTFFGFGYSVDHQTGLDCLYDGLTLGMVGTAGMRIGTSAGRLSLRDTWIGYDNGAVNGVQLVVLGAANTSSIILDGIETDVEAGNTADANSIGIAIESNQSNITIQNCNLAGNRLHDVRLNFAGKVSYSDNVFRSTTSGAHVQEVAFPGGPYHNLGGNVFGMSTPVFRHASNTNLTVASAATISVPGGNLGRLIDVTGTTTITAINATFPGDWFRLRFTSTAQVTDNGTTLNLAGNLTGAAGRVLTLVCDGTNMVEAGRSAN